MAGLPLLLDLEIYTVPWSSEENRGHEVWWCLSISKSYRQAEQRRVLMVCFLLWDTRHSLCLVPAQQTFQRLSQIHPELH